MQNFINKLSSAAESIKSMEEKKKVLAEFLIREKEKFSRDSEIMEDDLIRIVSPQKLSGKKIVAVDGGISQRSCFYPLHIINMEVQSISCISVELC